jgi:putative ABC transport system substrate-binding protein
MRRRGFIFGSAAVLWPVATSGQPAIGTAHHIAYLGTLSPTTLDPRQIEQFRAGLVENGLIEGQNVTVDYLWAEGSTERMLLNSRDAILT